MINQIHWKDVTRNLWPVIDVFARACVLIILAALLQSCNSGEDSTPPPSQTTPTSTSSQIEIKDLGTVSLPANSISDEKTVQVGAASFMLIANGGKAKDIDIDEVIDPTGKTLVSTAFDDLDPIGRNDMQAPGDSVATGLFPHTPHYPVPAGTYRFRVGAFEEAANIQLTAILNHRQDFTEGTLDLNILFCGIADLNSASALGNANFAVILNEFKRIYAQANIQVGTINTFDCATSDSQRLGSISSSDLNGNGEPDEMEELFQLSRNFPSSGLNFFFVQAIEGNVPGFIILGQTGGIPGPAVINGTVKSGVAVSLAAPTIGEVSQTDLIRRGRTMAHEGGHFFGLFHTTESVGANGNPFRVDPIQDTPECPTSRDLDASGDVSGDECLSFGGTNLMFWTQPTTAVRDQLSAGQTFVMQRNPLVQ